MLQKRPLPVVALCAYLIAGVAFGHHPLGEAFDTSRVIEIEGSIVALRWVDPHIGFTVLARDGRVWDVESSSIAELQSVDVSAQTLRAGGELVIAGFRAHDGTRSIYATHLLTSSGRKVVLSPSVRRGIGQAR